MPAPDSFTGLRVSQLAEGLDEGRWSSTELVSVSLRRIELLDAHFGAIRMVLEDAVDHAAESDRRRRERGPRSPIDGIPVVVKDNVDMAGVPTTAGALALERSVPARDAHLVRRLREAGAVLVAKANLTEMANFLTDDMPSGYSSLGGQVLNPYDLSFTPSGSSSGSAVAVALGMAPLAVGTETDGSITSPSEHQSLVGMKPTLGLVSRVGIVPISPSQDTAGPMAASVADAAALLAAMAGSDDADPATEPWEEAAAELRHLRLDPDALRGARLGVVRAVTDDGGPGRQACHDEAVRTLEAAGALLTDVTLPKLAQDDEFSVLHHEFAPALDAYLGALGPGAPIASAAELARWNRDHEPDALKFGQTHLERALSIDHEAEHATYRATRMRDVAMVVAAFEHALEGDLEALVLPGIEGSSGAARAGWPSIVVPAGYAAPNRRPVGLLFVAEPGRDARLLSLAYAFEQAHPVRRPPAATNPAPFRRYGL